MKRLNINKNKGITLIALVITIIVLLVLAGVSIAMLTGDNGILTQANNAKIEQCHGAVKEAINLKYSEWQIKLKIGDATKFASTEIVEFEGKEERLLANTSITFLDFLKGSNNEEINYIRGNNILNVEKLTGSKQALGNGETTDIYRLNEEENNYVLIYVDNKGTEEELLKIEIDDGIDINISKLEIKSTDGNNNIGVLLTVDSVTQNGEEIPSIELSSEEYQNMLLETINEMSDEEREMLYVNILGENGIFFDNFEEYLESLKEQGDLQGEGESLRDEFYNSELVGGKENFQSILVLGIDNFNYNLIGEYNSETGELKGFGISSLELLNGKSILATENREYTFKIHIQDRAYSKTINVNNISDTVIIDDNTNYNIGEISKGKVGLKDNESGDFTVFSNAYIIYKNQVIDVTNAITTESGKSVLDSWDARDIIGAEIGSYLCIIVKDNEYCFGKIRIYGDQ